MILNLKVYILQLIIFKTNLGLSCCGFLHDITHSLECSTSIAKGLLLLC